MDSGLNDLEQLAVLDPARGREPSPAQWSRSRAELERMLTGEPGTPPARRPVRRWVGMGVAVAAAAVVGVVAVPPLLSSTAETAFASWTPAPGSLTGEQVMPQARICAANGVGSTSSTVTPADVLLAEQRGLATLLILRKSDGVIVECMSVGPGEDDQLGSMALADGVPAAPPAGTVNLETMSSAGEGDGQWSHMIGLAGPGVTGVDIRLDDGTVFQASVRSGWWAAWWAGPEGGEVDRLTVIVHTATGSTAHRPSEMP